MSAHPEIETIAKVSPEDFEKAQRTMGILLARLIADDCPSQMKAASQSNGVDGIKIAFQYHGRMAMKELMSNPQVDQAIGGFQPYLDKVRVEQVFMSK